MVVTWGDARPAVATSVNRRLLRICWSAVRMGARVAASCAGVTNSENSAAC
jgi:hypothetical protein